MATPEQNVTIALPNAVYERAKVTAETLSLSLEEVLAQSLSLSLPAFENDLRAKTQAELTKLTLLSDLQLWKVAHQILEGNKQTQLAHFAELQKERQLTEAEQSTLTELMSEAQQLMLDKAEAYRLLAQRGHQIFSKPNQMQG